MQKIKNLLLILSITMLLPTIVFAKDKVNVYLFRRDGCQYCENALNFFDELSEDSEYSNYFNLVELEVSNNKTNANLMTKVAEKLDREVNGVPFIVVGIDSFLGYTSSYDDSIKESIKTAYLNEDGNYQDIVVDLIEEDDEENNDAAITIVIILVAVLGISLIVYMAHDNTEEVTKEKSNPKSKKKTTKKKK